MTLIYFKIGSIDGNLSNENLTLFFSSFDLFDLSDIGGISPLLSYKNNADPNPLFSFFLVWHLLQLSLNAKFMLLQLPHIQSPYL